MESKSLECKFKEHEYCFYLLDQLNNIVDVYIITNKKQIEFKIDWSYQKDGTLFQETMIFSFNERKINIIIDPYVIPEPNYSLMIQGDPNSLSDYKFMWLIIEVFVGSPDVSTFKFDKSWENNKKRKLLKDILKKSNNDDEQIKRILLFSKVKKKGIFQKLPFDILKYIKKIYLDEWEKISFNYDVEIKEK